MKIHGIAWTLDYLLQLDPSAQGWNFMESEAYELVDSAEKQNIADEFDHLFTRCILPPAKEILGSKTAGRGRPHMKNSQVLNYRS